MSDPSSTTTAPPRRTPLYDRHVALGAKMVDFAGWMMPIQYAGILEEHRTVRSAVGLFDVSHMGEVRFRGPRAAEAVQRLVTNDVGKLGDGDAMYTVTCREGGGIVDDCIVYRVGGEDFLIVVNASTAQKDLAHFREQAGAICQPVDESDATGLIAVQGPKAMALLGEIAPDAVPPRPFTFRPATIAGAACLVNRTGYTGEDGVEIACPAEATGAIWDLLLERGAKHGVAPIGLGARDTLRLEARLCLYGNDIDETTNPIEAGLGWVVKGKGYVGEEAIARVRAEGPRRKLVGFKVSGKGIARHGYPILGPGLAPNSDGPGEKVGEVTSGTVAPTAGGAVGLGYVPASLSAPGTRLFVDCRGKPLPVDVVAGPFYKRSAPTHS